LQMGQKSWRQRDSSRKGWAPRARGRHCGMVLCRTGSRDRWNDAAPWGSRHPSTAGSLPSGWRGTSLA